MKKIKLVATADKYDFETMDTRVLCNTIAERIVNDEIFGRHDKAIADSGAVNKDLLRIRNTSHKVAGCVIDAFAEVYPDGIDLWRFGFGLERMSINGCFDLKRNRLLSKKALTREMVYSLEQQKKDYKVRDGAKKVGSIFPFSKCRFNSKN